MAKIPALGDKPEPITIGALTYSFKLTFNRICDVERDLDTSLGAAINAMQGGINARYLRSFMVHGLIRPDGVDVTEAEASTIIDTIGMAKVATMVAEAVKRFLLGDGRDAA